MSGQLDGLDIADEFDETVNLARSNPKGVQVIDLQNTQIPSDPQNSNLVPSHSIDRSNWS